MMESALAFFAIFQYNTVRMLCRRAKVMEAWLWLIVLTAEIGGLQKTAEAGKV